MGGYSTACAVPAPSQIARSRWSNDAKLRRVADLLPPEQQQLLALWSSGTVSTRVLAALLRWHHGSLVRRISAIYRRLNQPIALHLAQLGNQLSPSYRELGVRMFIWGQPTRTIARDLGLSVYEVRRLRDEIRGWSVTRPNA